MSNSEFLTQALSATLSLDTPLPQSSDVLIVGGILEVLSAIGPQTSELPQFLDMSLLIISSISKVLL